MNRKTFFQYLGLGALASVVPKIVESAPEVPKGDVMVDFLKDNLKPIPKEANGLVNMIDEVKPYDYQKAWHRFECEVVEVHDIHAVIKTKDSLLPKYDLTFFINDFLVDYRITDQCGEDRWIMSPYSFIPPKLTKGQKLKGIISGSHFIKT